MTADGTGPVSKGSDLWLNKPQWFGNDFRLLRCAMSARKGAMRCLALSGLLVFSMPVFAGDVADSARRTAPKNISESFFRCLDRAGGDLVAIGACTSEEKQSQDQRLNRAYQVLMKKLDADAKAAMRASERAWVDFNAKAVAAELALRADDKTANVEAAMSELYRYCEQANALENFAFFIE
jgi:uncharacterized protein YecT (DUF1311 family)